MELTINAFENIIKGNKEKEELENMKNLDLFIPILKKQITDSFNRGSLYTSFGISEEFFRATKSKINLLRNVVEHMLGNGIILVDVQIVKDTDIDIPAKVFVELRAYRE